MYHESTQFRQPLVCTCGQSTDDLAAETRNKGCSCGGRLHCAPALPPPPRKPKGTPAQLPEPQLIRLSFCCDRDGCRKRATPPSESGFPGPKGLLGRHRDSDQRPCGRGRHSHAGFVSFHTRFGVGRKHNRPLADLSWREHFPQTPFWKVARQFPDRWGDSSASLLAGRRLPPAIIRRAKVGYSCCGFSRQSRFAGLGLQLGKVSQ